MSRKVTLDPQTVAPRTTSIYPPIYAKELVGREKRPLGDPFELTQFGVNLTTLAPGAWSSHRHWHAKEDEFIYILDGEVTLIDDDGAHLLKTGMCAGFKAGVANAHHLINKSGKSALILEVGSRMPGERSNYAEADMLAVKGDDGKWRLTRKDGSSFD